MLLVYITHKHNTHAESERWAGADRLILLRQCAGVDLAPWPRLPSAPAATSRGCRPSTPLPRSARLPAVCLTHVVDNGIAAHWVREAAQGILQIKCGPLPTSLINSLR